MYPRLSDVFQDLFGFTFPIPIYSFGAMVAVAVLTAVWLARKEFDRMYADGRVPGVRLPVEEKGKKRRTSTQVVSPSALLGTMTVLAVVVGIAGSKLFHILENMGEFARDPLGMIFSSGGLTFYGGLLMAGLAIAWFVRKKGVPVGAAADALAPGLMLGYGIGRIGCHLAGDGDWGIMADLSAKPGWLPGWLWAETYPNNILGIHLPDPGVYPTSVYEFVAAAALFGILWAARKHPYLNGWLFSLYLVFNGAERFFIEQIRVNNVFSFLGLNVTQAEVIATVIFLTGVVGLALTTRKRRDLAVPDASAVPQTA